MVVELDVRHDADLRPQPLDRPVGLVPFCDEPALAGTGVPAELGDLTAHEPRRVEAELGEHERDHPGRRRLPMRTGDHDRAPQRNELGEEVRAPACLQQPGRRSTRSPPNRPARPARVPARPRHPRAHRDTASRRGPSHQPRRPRRAQGMRTRTVRRRRFRRTTGAYREEAASSISSSAISSAACGRAIDSIAARIDSSRVRSASNSSTSAGTRARSASGTTTAPPPRSK